MEFGEDKIITDYQQPRTRNKWKSPQSWNGELGWWIEDEEKGTRNFIPRANFDFEIERELKDSEGGGLVLQFKRSMGRRKKRQGSRGAGEKGEKGRKKFIQVFSPLPPASCLFYTLVPFSHRQEVKVSILFCLLPSAFLDKK